VNALARQVATGPYWESVWNRVKKSPFLQRMFFKGSRDFEKPVSEEQYVDELQKRLRSVRKTKILTLFKGAPCRIGL